MIQVQQSGDDSINIQVGNNLHITHAHLTSFDVQERGRVTGHIEVDAIGDILEGSNKEEIHCTRCWKYVGYTVREYGVTYLCNDCREFSKVELKKKRMPRTEEVNESKNVGGCYNVSLPVEEWSNSQLSYYIENSEKYPDIGEIPVLRTRTVRKKPLTTVERVVYISVGFSLLLLGVIGILIIV